MNKLEAIAIAKQFRKDLDDILQRMKTQATYLRRCNTINDFSPSQREKLDLVFPAEIADDLNESIAQHTLSIRDLESAIMRQGMALKYIGNPNPYPESYNPASPVVAPTADGLTM